VFIREPVALILVGLGRRGIQWQHVLARRRDVRLVAVVDPSPQARSLSQAAPSWGSLAAALQANKGSAAAVVVTPPAWHVPVAIECLNAGLDVLVEKPFSLSLEEAASAIDVSRKGGRRLLVGQNFRFLGRELSVQKVLRSGRIGDVRSISLLSAVAASVPDLPDGKDEALWHFMIHHFDALRQRFGMPSEVIADRSQMGEGRALYEVRLKWPDGLVGSYRHIDGSSRYHYHEWIEGTQGSIGVVNDLVWERTSRLPRLRVARSNPESHLVDELLGRDRRGPASGELGADDNLLTLLVVDAVQRSLNKGGGVAISPDVGDTGDGER
jgi:predicted dehydrogenase